MFRFKNRKNFEIIWFECPFPQPICCWSPTKTGIEATEISVSQTKTTIQQFLAKTLFRSDATKQLFFLGKRDGILIPIPRGKEQKILARFFILNTNSLPIYSLNLVDPYTEIDLFHLAELYENESMRESVFRNERFAPHVKSNRDSSFPGRLYLDRPINPHWFIKTSSWRKKNFSAIKPPFPLLVRQVRPVHAKEFPAGA